MLLMRMTILIVVVYQVNGFWDSRGSQITTFSVAHSLSTYWIYWALLFILLSKMLLFLTWLHNCMSLVLDSKIWYLLCPSVLIVCFKFFFLTGALLLEEIITSCGMDGVDAVVDSIKRRISESQHQKDNGITGWWRVSWTVASVEYSAYHD